MGRRLWAGYAHVSKPGKASRLEATQHPSAAQAWPFPSLNLSRGAAGSCLLPQESSHATQSFHHRPQHLLGACTPQPRTPTWVLPTLVCLLSSSIKAKANNYPKPAGNLQGLCLSSRGGRCPTKAAQRRFSACSMSLNGIFHAFSKGNNPSALDLGRRGMG